MKTTVRVPVVRRGQKTDNACIVNIPHPQYLQRPYGIWYLVLICSSKRIWSMGFCYLICIEPRCDIAAIKTLMGRLLQLRPKTNNLNWLIGSRTYVICFLFVICVMCVMCVMCVICVVCVICIIFFSVHYEFYTLLQTLGASIGGRLQFLCYLVPKTSLWWCYERELTKSNIDRALLLTRAAICVQWKHWDEYVCKEPPGLRGDWMTFHHTACKLSSLQFPYSSNLNSIYLSSILLEKERKESKE